MTFAQVAGLGVFPLLVILAAMKDATSFTIPNWMSLAGVAAFAAIAPAMGVGPWAMAGALGCGVLALLLGMGMFCAGWIGGGDAKLFAMAALWLGWPALIPFMMVTAVAGGALAAGLLLMRPAGCVTPGPAWFGRLMEPDGDVPYGLAIAFGALFAFPDSLVVHAAGL